MKQLFILFVFLGLVNHLQAQNPLTLEPNPASIAADGTESILAPTAILKNVSSDTLRLFWRRIVENMPKEWEPAVCDQNSCYPPSRDVCPDDSPVILAPGDTTEFYVQAKHFDVEGEAIIKLEAYPVGFPDSVLITGVYNYSLVLTSADYIELTNSLLFPNPSENYFQLELPENQGKLELYSQSGQLLKTFEPSLSNRYDISDLAPGSYYIQWQRGDGIPVSALKLIKN